MAHMFRFALMLDVFEVLAHPGRRAHVGVPDSRDRSGAHGNLRPDRTAGAAAGCQRTEGGPDLAVPAAGRHGDGTEGTGEQAEAAGKRDGDYSRTRSNVRAFACVSDAAIYAPNTLLHRVHRAEVERRAVPRHQRQPEQPGYHDLYRRRSANQLRTRPASICSTSSRSSSCAALRARCSAATRWAGWST